MRWARSLDYSLIALVVGFALVAPVDRPFASLLSLLQGWRPSLFASYDAALREAAIKRPNYMVQLATIPPNAATVDVATLGPPSQPEQKSRTYDMCRRS